MEKQNDNKSNNSWQNLGICYIYAEEKIENPTLRCIYMVLVRKSFGYGKLDTGNITQEEIAKISGISIRTLRDKIKELESLGFVKIESPNTYRGGGGSYACKYFPDFPSGYGHIKQFDINSKNKENNNYKKDEKKTYEEIIKNNYF